MAAPEVTGAIALIKQMYPAMSSQEAGQFLKQMSNKTVRNYINYSTYSKNIAYPKPVLNFTNILKVFNVSDERISAQGQSIVIKLDRVAFSSKYGVKVIDLTSKQEIPVNFAIKPSGIYTYITIKGNGNLKNGNVYRLEITRYLNIKGKITQSTVIKYAAPQDSLMSLTAIPRDKGVSLNVNLGTGKNRGVKYSVYNPTNNRLLKQITVPGSSAYQTLTGYVNGIKYAVTARPYWKVAVNRKKLYPLGEGIPEGLFCPAQQSSELQIFHIYQRRFCEGHVHRCSDGEWGQDPLPYTEWRNKRRLRSNIRTAILLFI